jgi:hypothetical protein
MNKGKVGAPSVPIAHATLPSFEHPNTVLTQPAGQPHTTASI